jgi:hypothetical protein
VRCPSTKYYQILFAYSRSATEWLEQIPRRRPV